MITGGWFPVLRSTGHSRTKGYFLTNAYIRFWVQLSGLSHTLADGTSRTQFNFTGRNSTYIVDTGTTGIYLPRETVASIMSDLKLNWAPSQFSSVSCSLATNKGFLTFTLGGRAIRIPYSTLILENTPGQCLFLITSVESNAIDLHILGCRYHRNPYKTLKQR
jgi:hypothetical protein